jgi:putative FmdB family regulatory protein
MPEYSFHCPQCGTKFDQHLDISSDRSHIRCPNGHPNVQRRYTAPQVSFKGSGFYITDSKKKAKTA